MLTARRAWSLLCRVVLPVGSREPGVPGGDAGAGGLAEHQRSVPGLFQRNRGCHIGRGAGEQMVGWARRSWGDSAPLGDAAASGKRWASCCALGNAPTRRMVVKSIFHDPNSVSSAYCCVVAGG